MEDVEIMETMKEVLKRTLKSKHKKSHKPKSFGENEVELSEILSEKWKFSSPPGSNKVSTEKKDSPKVNAFDLMMTKKSEPLTTISPEVNRVKKKKTFNRKSKKSKVEDDSLEQLPVNENAKTPVVRERKKGLSQDQNDETITRKRIRSNDTLIINEATKKRKTKTETLLLDSNENAMDNSLVDQETDERSHQSSRPRRSCASKVSYEHLISPEKTEKPERARTPRRRVAKELKEVESEEVVETFVIDGDSPVKQKKPVKLAPLFMKKVPKPSIDPVVQEARRSFLMSGLPEQMRCSIDKHRRFEETILTNELIAFPSISHVTQLQSDGINNISSWKESIIAIKADDEEEKAIPQRLLTRGLFTDCRDGDIVPVECDKIRPKENEKLENLKSLVSLAKESFQNFPTNRCFKKLHWEFKKSKGEVTGLTNELDSTTNTGELMFVDIFKPQTLDEFVVNTKPAKELQKFLLTWNDKNDDSECSDSSSWHSSKSNNNFTVLSGSHGVGKTMSVYAVAKELNYQVIEINAGSRRSGKKMLQDLLEATQSHRVKDKSKKMISTQDESEYSQESNYQSSPTAKSIILIEDAELVFEADDGFVSTLQQLINISKRPVILTTNNRNCQHLQKFIRHSEIVYQKPKSTNQIGKYLSLLCLAANCRIDAEKLERLYALNGHDLRKTINEIEFFIRSGNSRTRDSMNFKMTTQYESSIDRGRPNYSNESISTICFQSSIVSSFSTIFVQRAIDYGSSYQQCSLLDEMEEFFTERCNVAKSRHDLAYGGKRKIESSSISNDLILQPSNLSATQVLATDYSPMLRAICRSEKSRREIGRRTTNNRGHYLRFLITNNSFGNDYFNEQCEVFQQ